jgi:ABC-2 type transport system ATP-binding protein
MKRRLNMAVALVHEPDLLVLDEPTVGVDPQSRNAIFEALETLQANGLTLLYTTHYMEEVERLCDRIAIIDHGKIVADDSLEGLFKLIPTRSVTKLVFRDEATAKHAETVLLPCKSATTVLLTGTEVDFGAEDMVAGLAEATAALRDAGIPVESVQTERPTLEEVFLHCTGRSLRDQ